tara:strand:+ start:6586 stop:7167 length:582 start_codon:yes stop_codon:yes gene_type:complete
MIRDMDNMCGMIAVVLLILIFINFQKDYRLVHRTSASACGMASSESEVSGKASLSIEPEATEAEGETSPLELGVLNKDVWDGTKKELSEEELATQKILDQFIGTIDNEKFDEHMSSGCNANITKPTYKKIIDAGAANRNVLTSRPTFSKNIGRTGFHAEARKFYAPETDKCEKPKIDLYFNGTEAHFEAQKCN